MKKTLAFFCILFLGNIDSFLAQFCFSPALNYGIGVQRASSIFSADFNGDGNKDLVTSNGGVNNTNNNITLLLGTGTGVFGPPLNFAVGSEPDYLTCADFNGDGNMDVATSNFISSNVSILLGTGTGSFAPTVNYTVNSGPGQIITGDFNGDGNKDLAVTSYWGVYGTILLGNGTGSFVFGSSLSAGRSALVGADFDGDGIMDIATSDTPNYYFISKGFSNGTFATGVTYTLGVPYNSAITNLITGDFNGDNKVDLLATCPGEGRVRLLFGYGNGTFSTSVSYTVGTYPSGLVKADFNGDGKLDFATSNCNYTDTICVRLNNGNGTFAAGINYAVGPNSAPSYAPYTLATADFNGDGKADLATGNFNTFNISVLLNIRPTVSATSGTVCAGKPYTIVPSGAVSYTVSGGSLVVSPYVTTTYSISGTGSQGCVSFNKAVSTITVKSLPTLVLNPSAVNICVGETATLSVTGALTYTWNTAENTEEIVVSPSIQSTYSVIGMASNGCENTKSYVLNVDACVGIQAHSPSTNLPFKLYPNPTSGLLFVEMVKGNKITIINSIGQAVYAADITEEVQKIDLEHLQKGVYLLRVNNADSNPTHSKIIKQ